MKLNLFPRRIGLYSNDDNIESASSMVVNSTRACCFRAMYRNRLIHPNPSHSARRSDSEQSSGRLRMCITFEGTQSAMALLVKVMGLAQHP
jgi:hypothetical protein